MSEDSFETRPARTTDKQQWLTLWKEYQNFYGVDLSATSEDSWARIMSPGPDGPFCLVAEDNRGNLAGFATFIFHIHTWQPEPRCYLVDLFTRPDLRRRGVGRTLISSVYKEADSHNCSQTYWLTQSFNEAGRRLYDQVAQVTPFIKYQR